MRKLLMVAVLLMTAVMAKAQDNTNRIGVGLGGYYRPAATRPATTMRGSSMLKGICFSGTDCPKCPSSGTAPGSNGA